MTEDTIDCLEKSIHLNFKSVTADYDSIAFCSQSVNSFIKQFKLREL